MRSNSHILLATIAFAGLAVHAQDTVQLGTAGDFAVLAGSEVTNTGPTVVEGGHVGVSPGSAIVGFPPGIVVPPHTIHAADAVALQAQSDLTIAYNTAAGLAPTQNLTGQDLGGLTLTTGVYFFASSAQLTGTLTLDAQGDPDAQFVFQIGSTLTTASNSSVVLINGAQACNVFWQVGSSATLGTNTTFVGNILALTSITLVTGVDVDGRLLARNGAVTLDSNTISAANCVECFLDADCPPEAPFCDPVTGVCVECVTNENCDDGLFCNGAETCAAAECQPGSDPCLPLACDEATDTCDQCFGSSCPEEAPFCDPDTGLCVECLADGDCDDQEVCTVDTCDPTTHQCEYDCTDEVDPVGDCGDTDISVPCDEPVPGYFPTFTDNCDTTLTFDFVTTDSDGSCPQEHTIEQSVTATDICGNATTCTRTVRVVDDGPPVVECPPDTSVSCEAPRSPAQTGSATATDSCDPSVAPPTFTDENDLDGCNGTGTITRTWTAMDDCGNSGSCVQTITVVDETDPVITCPGPATLDCDESTVPGIPYGTATGGIMIRYNDADPEAPENQAYLKVQASQINDNGAPFEFSDAPLTGSGFTWALLYGQGAVSQFGFDLVLELPTATIPIPYTTAYANTDSTIAGRAAAGLVRWAINDYKPNVGGPAIPTNDIINSLIRSVTPPNANPDVDIEIISLELTSTAPFTLTISGVLHSDGIHHWFSPGTPDSPMSNFNLNGDFYFSGTLVYDPLLDITDDGDFYAGTIEIFANSPSVELGFALATDNCNPFPVVSYEDDLSGLTGCDGTGTIIRTWMADDGCGNSATCTQTITVEDTAGPTIVCPADVSVQCGESTEPENTGSATATDSCDASVTPTFTDEVDPGGCVGGTGTITRTWTAMDDCGNPSSCVQTITIMDDASPVITCPPDITRECDESTDPADTGTASAIDDCDTTTTPTFTDESDLSGCDGTGTIIRTWSVEDACGNPSSCMQTITIVDTVGPTVTCPANISVQCGESTAPTDTGSATATDSCDPSVPPPTFADENDLDGCNGTGTIIRTWTAMDDCGNPGSCVQTITVVDETNPMITCPPDITRECGQSTAPADTGTASATDDCGTASPATFTDVNDLDGCDGTGTITRTWRAEDACGNPSTCTQTITIVDTVGPMITCPPAATVQCGESTDPADTGSATATDACDASVAAPTFTDENPGGCDGTGVITRTWTAMEDCGNPSSCVQLITILGLTTPVITCPPDITLPRGDKICSDAVQEWLDSATATNACGELVNDAPECGFPFGSTTTVTWTVDDGCDNEIPCSADITIGPAPRVDNDKGSVIIFTKVDLRWNAAGELTQDTFLTLTNDFPDDVYVQLYFVNGDASREPVFSSGPAPILIANGEPGWNWVDCQVLLTPDQPVYWSASSGSPLGCQPFTILDPDLGSGAGRPAPDANDGSRVLRGFVLAFAVDQSGAEIQWNHLSGKATIVDYTNTTAWEYDAFAFQAGCGSQGQQPLDCTLFDEQGVCCTAEVIPGALGTDGFQYDYAFDVLLLDFFGVGSQALSGPATPTTVDTDLTLHILSADLRQETEGPVTTKVHFDIWNMNERKLSNTRRCLTCWDQTLLSQYNAPNSFLRENLQSDQGKARIEGLQANECEANCLRDELGEPLAIEDVIDLLGDLFNPAEFMCSQDAALLGLAAKHLAFSGPAGQRAVAGSNLVGMGTERALIQYDVVSPPGTLKQESYDRTGQSAGRGGERLPDDVRANKARR